MKTRPTETTARRGPHTLFVTVIVFLLAVAAAATLVWRMEQQRLREERARVAILASDHASDLQRRFDRAFAATYALAALVRQGHGGITDFEEIAHQLLPYYPGAVALQLAPGGVIRQSVPLAGNEKALGHDLLKDTARNKEAILAHDTGKLTLAGPFDLMQGGVGAVARLPVYLGDMQGNRAFWGFTTVLVRFPEILDGTLLARLAERGFGFELWRIHPDTGKKQVIAESASFPLVAAVEHPLSVPNGAWTLSIAPAKGWGNPVGLSLKVALGLLFSLLLAWLTKLLIESKAHEAGLEVLVAERTAEIRQSEAKFRSLSQEFNGLLDAIPDSLMLLDRDLNILWANRAAVENVGTAAEELDGCHCFALWRGRAIPCDPCPVMQCFAAATPKNETITRPDGRIWDIRTVPLLDEHGQVTKVIELKRDITEHKKLEKNYLHAQKMESIGTLAGGVAHDFNNILTVIVGLGHLTLMKMADDDPYRGNLGGILAAAERATHLTKELLLFSRKQESERRPVDLNNIISKTEKFLHRIIGEDIALTQVPHGSPLPVLADSHQLEQVLMNLAVNARDAMPQGGELILRTEETTLHEDFVATHGYGQPGAYALLSVSDTGTGMDKATQQRIFEPFFSTKEVGKGTGLGLAVVYGIVKQHDGFITVYSEPGVGSTFRIYLPLTTAARQESKDEERRAVAGGTETILLAEDNDLVQELLTCVLTEAGYTVIVAVDGTEAVHKFKENADSIQLLLFDLIMPKMNGKEAADEIHKIRPGMKTIFASGYAPDIVQQKAPLNDGCHLISKPVSPRDLLKKVRDVLDGVRA